MCRRRAAADIPPSSATATNARSSRISMALSHHAGSLLDACGRSCDGLALKHPGAGPDVAVAVDDSELDVEAVQPFVVVDGSPVKQASHVYPPGDCVTGYLQAALKVGGALVVIAGPDAVLSHQQWRARHDFMQPVKHSAEAIGPDGVPQRGHRRVGRVRDQGAVADSHCRVERETNQVDGAG